MEGEREGIIPLESLWTNTGKSCNLILPFIIAPIPTPALSFDRHFIHTCLRHNITFTGVGSKWHRQSESTERPNVRIRALMRNACRVSEGRVKAGTSRAPATVLCIQPHPHPRFAHRVKDAGCEGPRGAVCEVLVKLLAHPRSRLDRCRVYLTETKLNFFIQVGISLQSAVAVSLAYFKQRLGICTIRNHGAGFKNPKPVISEALTENFSLSVIHNISSCMRACVRACLHICVDAFHLYKCG